MMLNDLEENMKAGLKYNTTPFFVRPAPAAGPLLPLPRPLPSSRPYPSPALGLRGSASSPPTSPTGHGPASPAESSPV
ncbi:hypothetical protein ZWY2020_044918 [Hordeum vulgare]|nr:hypothetical protein ZWY2020_044918 [Hordeum vulgare]